MKQALLIVLDSLGIGHAPDANAYGDEGANTLGHIRAAVPGFTLPHLDRAGLAHTERLAEGETPHAPTLLSTACLTEASTGKDTITGHWELAGATLALPFATFNRFPERMVKEMESACGVTFIGNVSSSGTVILEELGGEHLRTGYPILYTSADSVIQIAAHESIIPVARLYEICNRCRTIADRERIGRVIARPFEGEKGTFRRTANRHDFSMIPPDTILNRLSRAEVDVIGVGKIADIFSNSGITRSFPTTGNSDGCAVMDRLLLEPFEKPRLIFSNLVDFDSLYGHRRDPAGYADALQAFDEWFGLLLPRLGEETLLLITADHGNDPTWIGTDHTRERVPLLMRAPGEPLCRGVRKSFTDVAATLGEWFGISEPSPLGRSLFA